MRAVPNGIITLNAVLPGTTGGATGGTTGGTAVATQSLFSIPLRVYRTTQAKVLPTIAPIVPNNDLTFKVTYTSEKPTQNVTIRVYSARGETLRFVKDIDIGMTDKTLAAADLGGQGTYLLYFLLADGTVFAAQKVQLGVAKYTVEFRDWNGELLKSETVSSGESATPPTVENRENYAFSGWQGNYKNVIANSVVVAQYSPTFVTVTFHAMGGKLVGEKEVTVGYNTALTAPAEPTKDLYTFAGWFTAPNGIEQWNFGANSQPVKSNMVLYAHWKAPSYSISIESTIADVQIQCQTNATPGELVKITVTPPQNKALKTLWWQETTGGMTVIPVTSGSGSFEMPSQDITIHATFSALYTLTINVTGATERPGGLELYNTSSGVTQYIGGSKFTQNAGNTGDYSVTIQDLPESEYRATLHMGAQRIWYYDSKAIQLTRSSTVQFAVPTIHMVSGTITCAAGLPSGIWLNANPTSGSNGSSAGCSVRADGSYNLTGLQTGSYTLTASGRNVQYQLTPNTVTVTDKDIQNNNIALTKGADLVVNLETSETEPAFRADIMLERQNGSRWVYVNTLTGSAENGTQLILTDGITETGTYRITLQRLYGKNYVNIPFAEIKPTTFTVTELIRASCDLSYRYPNVSGKAFSGTGNFVAFDRTEVYPGGRVNLEIHYQNNDTSAQSTTFAVVLPAGVSYVVNPPTLTVSNVAPKISGKLVLPLKLDSI
ncbi:MAG: InlB B-repeat-containing protein, partial [Oscillospiraceae bacterium]